MWSALIPGGLLGWRQRRRALRDLDDFQRLDQSILGLDEANPVNRAKVALESGDTSAALQFWHEAVARYPGFARGSRDALTILLGLRLFDEAEALMREGQRRAPRDLYYADGLARIAERRGDNEEAIPAGNGYGRSSQAPLAAMSGARSAWRERASWTRRKR
jgi:hypothetical protein